MLATLREAFRLAYVISVVNNCAAEAVDESSPPSSPTKATPALQERSEDSHDSRARDFAPGHSPEAQMSASPYAALGHPAALAAGKREPGKKARPKKKKATSRVKPAGQAHASRSPGGGGAAVPGRRGGGAAAGRPQQGLRWSPKSSSPSTRGSYQSRLEHEAPELALAVAARAREVAEHDLKLKQLRRRQQMEHAAERRVTREAELAVMAREQASYTRDLRLQRQMERRWVEQRRRQADEELVSTRARRRQESEERLEHKRKQQQSRLASPKAAAGPPKGQAAKRKSASKGRRRSGTGGIASPQTAAADDDPEQGHEDRQLLVELAAAGIHPPVGMLPEAAAMIAHAAQVGHG